MVSGLQETWAYELMKMASLEDEAGKNIWERRIIERNERQKEIQQKMQKEQIVQTKLKTQ